MRIAIAAIRVITNPVEIAFSLSYTIFKYCRSISEGFN